MLNFNVMRNNISVLRILYTRLGNVGNNRGNKITSTFNVQASNMETCILIRKKLISINEYKN